MRTPVLAGVFGSLGLLLAFAACTSETTVAPGETAQDGGTGGTKKRDGSAGSSGSSGGEEEETDGGTTTKKDSGTPPVTFDIPSDTLVEGDLQLMAIAVDDAIYLEFGQTTNTLFAVPIASGAPTKIADIGETDDFSVSGGAVAVWNAIDASGLGNLSVWTRAGGLKANVATKSGAGAFFEASEDGTRIAFTQDITLTNGEIVSLPIGIRDTSAATNAVTLTGTTASGNAFNFASADCQPAMTFVGKTFFAEFCTGTSTTASTAKLITVAGNGTTVTRLDAATAGSAATLLPSAGFSVDSAGSKVFVVRKTNNEGRIITVGGTAGGTTVETTIAEGVMLSDGSAVVYRTAANALKKATTAASPVVTTLAATDAKGLLGVSRDAKNVFFHKLDLPANSQLTDISVVDQTASSPAPVALVPTLAGLLVGVNGPPTTHAVFLGDVTQTGADLKSIPVGGGAVTSLGASVGALLAGVGDTAVSVSNITPAPQPNEFNVSDITAVDVTAGTKKTISTDVPEGEMRVKGKRLVYTRFAAQGSGLYAADLP